MKFCFCCKLLKIVCCPPCPRSIIEYVAFQPPTPSYEVFSSEAGEYTFQLEKRFALDCLSRFVSLKDVEFRYATTKHGTKIACMYYSVKSPSTTTILYSHGNGSDLGCVIGLCVWLAKKIECNILVYDYSGYGRSTGKPSEKRLYADIEAAFHLLVEYYHCSPNNIILMGQSLGSAPTIDLASRIPVRAVIIQSGFASALNVAFPNEDLDRSLCCDVFGNIDKVCKIRCPALVIHGTEDDIIDISNGEALHKKLPAAVAPLWVEGAGHNDVELFVEYHERLSHFIATEIVELLGQNSET